MAASQTRLVSAAKLWCAMSAAGKWGTDAASMEQAVRLTDLLQSQAADYADAHDIDYSGLIDASAVVLAEVVRKNEAHYHLWEVGEREVAEAVQIAGQLASANRAFGVSSQGLAESQPVRGVFPPSLGEQLEAQRQTDSSPNPAPRRQPR